MTDERRLGRTEVSPMAVAGLAAAAVLECYGVVGMAHRSNVSGLDGLLKREHYRRGVQVTVADQEIIIDLYVVLEYGVRISEVAHNIMENVKFRVEKALGLPIEEINVHVRGLRLSSR